MLLEISYLILYGSTRTCGPVTYIIQYLRPYMEILVPHFVHVEDREVPAGVETNTQRVPCVHMLL